MTSLSETEFDQIKPGNKFSICTDPNPHDERYAHYVITEVTELENDQVEVTCNYAGGKGFLGPKLTITTTKTNAVHTMVEEYLKTLDTKSA